MRSIKLVIILILFLLAAMCSAQDQNDFILLTDSTYLLGNVSTRKNQVMLDHKSFDKPKFYNLEQVLAFRSQNDLYEIVTNFVVTYDINRKKSKDFHIEIGYAKVVIQGKVTLYEFGFYVENHLGEWKIAPNSGFFSGGAPAFPMAPGPGGNGTMAMMPTGTLACGGPYLVTQYVLKRSESSELVAVPSGVHPEKFQEFISSFFVEYAELAYEIKRGNYSLEQMKEVVNTYNMWVTKHPDAAKLIEQKSTKLNGF
jgi:hypothetical protein